MTLKTLAALQEKATKGPWTTYKGFVECKPFPGDDFKPVICKYDISGVLDGGEIELNGDFIAACGSFDFTALCDEMEMMRKALESIATGKDENGNKVDFYQEIAAEALGGKDE